MKKFIFSAIAMMAFSVGSLANNIDLETTESLGFVESKETVAVDCFDVALELEAAYVVVSITLRIPFDAYAFFAASYDSCVATMDCPTCLEGN